MEKVTRKDTGVTNCLFLIRPMVWIFLFGFQRKQSGRNPKTEENNLREETSVNPGKKLSH